MIKFIADVLQLAIALRLLYAVLKWMVSNKKKSIAYKLYKIVARKVHRKLDAMLKAQENVQPQKAKVIPLKKVR